MANTTATTTTENANANVNFVITKAYVRTISYKDAETKELRSYDVVHLSTDTDVLDKLTDTGEVIKVREVEFYNSYFRAYLHNIPGMDIYLANDDNLVGFDRLLVGVTVEIEQSLHSAGDAIPNSNNFYSRSGYANNIVGIKLTPLAKLQLKYCIAKAAYMSEVATDLETKVKAILTAEANDAFAALDNF